MKRVGILGDIGSGKSYVSKKFGYPIFNADIEVTKLYRKNKKIFNRLRKVLPKYFFEFPIDKDQVSKAILANDKNLKKIIKIVHLEIKKKLNSFLKKNNTKKIVILDIPLLLENKINKKNDVLVFVESNKSEIIKRLKKRKNYNQKLLRKFRKIQFSPDFKKRRSQFIIKNDYKDKTAKKYVKYILKKILIWKK